MKEHDIYFAGLFDGEGCVTIDKALKSRGAVNAVYRITVQLAMVDIRPLNALLEIYGVGGVYKASFGRLALAQAYRWCAASKSGAIFLRRIRPYTRVKSEEIDIALAFQEHVESNVGYRKRLAEDTMAYREDCRVRLQALKRRFRIHQSPGEPYHLTPRRSAPRW